MSAMDEESTHTEQQKADRGSASEKRERTERRKRTRKSLLMAACAVLLVAAVAGLVVVLTMGTDGLKVPDIIGMPFGEATGEVRSVGLVIEIDRGQDSSVECGDLKVMAQDPKPGTVIEKNETVTVILEGLHDSPEYAEDIESEETVVTEQEAEQTQVSVPEAAPRAVCLDPGHSGRSGSEIDTITGLNVGDNTGAAGERQAMWELAQRANARLEQAGYSVKLTKPDVDAYVTLRERVDIGNTCDIVIRLHYDDTGFTGVMRAPENAARCPESDPSRATVIDTVVARESNRLAADLAATLGLSVRNDTGGTSMGNATPPGHPTALIGSVLSRVPVVCIENQVSLVRDNPEGQEQVAARIVEGVNAYFQGT